MAGRLRLGGEESDGDGLFGLGFGSEPKQKLLL